MTKIKTTGAVVFDARVQKSEIIEVELTAWKETNSQFIAEISDFWLSEIIIKNDQDEDESIIQRNFITNRTVALEAEKINQLSAHLESMIPAETPEVERREILKKNALLVFVQTDFLTDFPEKCIYNTDPDQWIIAD